MHVGWQGRFHCFFALSVLPSFCSARVTSVFFLFCVICDHDLFNTLAPAARKEDRGTEDTFTRRMASHGNPEILEAPAPERPQRPLTADEKLAQTTFDVESSPKSSEWGGTNEAPYEAPAAVKDDGILATMRRWEAAMDRKLGIESHAIDRKLPEDRKAKMTWRDNLTMAALWASGTMNLSCFATGFLGWKFGLDLK